LRQYWKSDFKTVTDSAKIGDTAANLSISDLGKFAGYDMSGSARYYFPTSQDSQAAGKNQARAYLSLEKTLSKSWSTSLLTSPRAYFYTKSSAGQSGLAWFNAVDATYKVNDKFSISPALGLYNVYSNTGVKSLGKDSYAAALKKGEQSKHSGTSLDLLYLTLGASFSINDHVSMSAAIEQERSLRGNSAFVLLNDEETYYAFELIVSI